MKQHVESSHHFVLCLLSVQDRDKMLESYVTPLLMSYVNKYIKNLKPSDLQLSLWGGDVVLSKLDLKLDVLEQVQYTARNLCFSLFWVFCKSKRLLIEMTDIAFSPHNVENPQVTEEGCYCSFELTIIL